MLSHLLQLLPWGSHPEERSQEDLIVEAVERVAQVRCRAGAQPPGLMEPRRRWRLAAGCLVVPGLLTVGCTQDDESHEHSSQVRDISAFVAPTGLAEVKFIRRLSTMCSQTYLMSKLTVRAAALPGGGAACPWSAPSGVTPAQERTLHRRLGLRLVTSSTAMLSHRPPKRSLREIVEYADAMGATRQDAEQAQADALCTEESPAMKVGPATSWLRPCCLLTQADSSSQAPSRSPSTRCALPQAFTQTLQGKSRPSPTDAVAASLQSAFGAAAAVASSLTAPLASWGSAAAHTLPMQAVTHQLQGAAAAGQSTAVATMATVRRSAQLPPLCCSAHCQLPVPAGRLAGQQAASSQAAACSTSALPERRERGADAVAVQVGAAVDSAWSQDDALDKAARAKATSPTQWYVADNLADHTRFFVIQGSETLDHWCARQHCRPAEFWPL